MCSPNSSVPILLFFDTFAHNDPFEAEEEINLDLVQFPIPVIVEEVRVVPLGSRVEGNFPGKIRLGATNPSQFEVEFFVNDLGRPGISTFESLGVLQYETASVGGIQFRSTAAIPTDGLLLKGPYQVITLAVYGHFANLEPEEPPSPALLSPVLQEGSVPPSVPIGSSRVPASPPASPKEDGTVGESGLGSSPPSPASRKRKRSRSGSTGRHPGDEHSEVREVRYRKRKRDGEETGDGFEDTLPRSKAPQSPSPESPATHRERRRRRHRDHEDLLEEDDEKKSETSSSGIHRKIRERPAASPSEPRATKRRDNLRSSYHAQDGPRSPPSPYAAQVALIRSPSAETEGTGSASGIPVALLEDVEAISDEEESVGSEKRRKGSGAEDEQGEHQSRFDIDELALGEDGLPDTKQLLYFRLGTELEPDVVTVFDPFSEEICDSLPPALQYFPDPSKYPEENARRKHAVSEKNSSRSPDIELRRKINLLKESLDCGDQSAAKGLEILETITTLLSESEVIAFITDRELEALSDSVVRWVYYGLSLATALEQPKAPNKVRHLKIGLKLANTVIWNCHHWAQALLEQRPFMKPIFDVLRSLFLDETMCLPFRLLILQIVDAFLSVPGALQCLVIKRSGSASFYETLVNAASQGNKVKDKVVNSGDGRLHSRVSVRIRDAASRLLRKVELKRALDNLRCVIGTLAGETLETIQPIESSIVSSSFDDPFSSPPFVHLDDGYSGGSFFSFQTSKAPSRDNISQIARILQDVLYYYTHLGQTLVPPPRYLPALVQYSVPPAPVPLSMSLSQFFRLLTLGGLMDSLAVLVTSLTPDSRLSALVSQLLVAFQGTPEGLFFLASHPQLPLILKTYSHEWFEQDSWISSVFLNALYSLEVVKHVDNIHAMVARGLPPTSLFPALTALHALLFSSRGKIALSHVLTMGDLMRPLLPFLEATETAEQVLSADLVVTAIQYRHGASVESFHLWQDLWRVVKKDDIPSNLKSLRTWISPMIVLKPYDALLECLESDEFVREVPGEIVMCLRLLQSASSPQVSFHGSPPPFTELRYQDVLNRLCEADLQRRLLCVISSIVDQFGQPSAVPFHMISHQGYLSVCCLQSSISLLKRVIQNLTEARGSEEYRDLSPIGPLVHAWTYLQAVPSLAPHVYLAQQAKIDVVDALLAYTRTPKRSGSGGGEFSSSSQQSLQKSLWTSMLRELLETLLQAPQYCLAGVQLLSELFPLPLPVLVPPGSSLPFPVASILRQRALWATHLTAVTVPLTSLLSSLFPSVSTSLLHALTRVLKQLADLGASTALIVARVALGSLPVPGDEDCAMSEETKCTLLSGIAFFSRVLSFDPIKSASVQVLQGLNKSDARYSMAFKRLCDLLISDESSSVDDRLRHAILLMFEALCDWEVGMAKSHSLPSREQLKWMIQSLLRLIALKDTAYATILLALKTLLSLTKTNDASRVFKTALNSSPTVFPCLFDRFTSKFDLDKHLLDFSAALSSLVELVTSLLVGSSGTVWSKEFKERTFNDAEDSMLRELEKLVEVEEVESNHDDFYDRLPRSIRELIGRLEKVKFDDIPFECGGCDSVDLSASSDMLESSDKQDTLTDVGSGDQEDSPSLQELFETRATVSESPACFMDDERLSNPFWMTSVERDESVDPEDQVRCCLSKEMAGLVFPAKDSVDWRKEVEGFIYPAEKLKESEPLEAEETAYDPDPVHERIVSVSTTSVRRQPPMPSRNRNVYSRPPSVGGPGSVSGIGRDSFRIRQPNTSRPPSVHVDDFVALENQGQHPTGPTGYNPASKRALEMLRSRRSRNSSGGSGAGRYGYNRMKDSISSSRNYY